MSEYHYAVMAALPGFAPRLAADEPRRVLLWAHADIPIVFTLRLQRHRRAATVVPVAAADVEHALANSCAQQEA